MTKCLNCEEELGIVSDADLSEHMATIHMDIWSCFIVDNFDEESS